MFQFFTWGVSMSANLSHQKYDQAWGAKPIRETDKVPVFDFLRKSAAADPQKEAMIFLHHVTNYADLDLYSDRVAAYLASLGLKKGDRVATMLPNCTQHAIAIYGILKAGCVMVPFNVMLKDQEVNYICKQSGAKAIFCLDLLAPMVLPVAAELGMLKVVSIHATDFSEPTANIPPLLSLPKQEVEGVVDFMEIIGADQGPVPQPHIDAENDLACLLYTSGTTGFPKGAMITHCNYNHSAGLVVDGLTVTEQDRLYLLFPMFHVGGQALILMPAIMAGATCAAIPMFDPEEMLDLIQRFKLTFGFAPPTAYIGLLNHPKFNEFDLSSLTRTLASGAPVPPALQDQWQEKVGTYLYAGYGCTETTACGPGAVELVNKNKPGCGTLGVCTGEIKIINEKGEIVPRGEQGEFVLRGEGIVKGYWQNPEETAKLFTGDGWWYSGDAGYMDEDGFLFFVERIKDLIVASGYNIAPAEVENYLYQHPAVLEAAVVGVPDDYRGETVKAFVVPKPDAKVTEQDILAFCKEKMAAYKAPKLVEFIDELPKNLTGKVLRRILRERETEGA